MFYKHLSTNIHKLWIQRRGLLMCLVISWSSPDCSARVAFVVGSNTYSFTYKCQNYMFKN